MMRVWTRIFLLALIGGAFVIVQAQAQGLNLSNGTNGQPISIDAAGGIEWHQEEQLFIATGPAKATQGNMTIDADEMRAYYREGGKNGSEVIRLDAIGNVEIRSPGRVATGGHAVYDVERAVMVLKDGDPVKLISGGDVIIANGQLEFWDQRNLAVARGGAQAARTDKRIRADVLTAHFEKGPDGKNQVQLIEAFDNVRIDTAREQVFSDRGAYNVPTGLARLTGSVRIKRGSSVINGCSADIDLNTGVSRLNSCEGATVQGTTQTGPGAATKPAPGRIHGVLSPKDKQ